MTGPRHRWGSPPSPRPLPPIWDVHQREQAALINSREPGWVVVYGPWRRRFSAFAAWPTPRPVVVDASTPEELWGEMRSAEATHGMVPPKWRGEQKS